MISLVQLLHSFHADRLFVPSPSRFYLADTFGDGWGHSALNVFDLHGFHASYAPTSVTNPVTVQYCFNEDSEEGRVVVAALIGLNPEKYWEVCASLCRCVCARACLGYGNVSNEPKPKPKSNDRLSRVICPIFMHICPLRVRMRMSSVNLTDSTLVLF